MRPEIDGAELVKEKVEIGSGAAGFDREVVQHVHGQVPAGNAAADVGSGAGEAQDHLIALLPIPFPADGGGQANSSSRVSSPPAAGK